MGIATLVAIPLPDDLGLFWAGSGERAPFTEAQVGALSDLADRLVERSRQPETDESLGRRLERLESLADVLPLIARALDLRDVFERLSEVARRALPHDTCVVGIHSEDHTEVRLHALSGSASLGGLPEVVPNPYPKTLAVSREFAIIRDLVSHPFERAGIGARLGLRSALRLPLSLDGRLKGVLDFSSFEVGPVQRSRPADRPAHRGLRDAGDVAQGDRRPGPARGDAGRARHQPERARRAAVHADQRAGRAPGRRPRVGDRADRAAARRDVDSAADRGRRSRARVRQQRARRRADAV